MRVRLPNGSVRSLLAETALVVGDRIETPDLGDLRVTGFEGETVLAEPVGPPPVRVVKPWIRSQKPAGSGVA